MKRFISAAVALGAVCVSPVQAETWVHAGTQQGTYSGGIIGNDQKRVVHHVDIGSVVTANGLRYFNRKVTHYKLEAGEWRYQWETVAGNSRADCSRKALMIASSDADGTWDYRRGSGEWWSQRQIDNGSREKGLSIHFAQKMMGFNTIAEYLASDDRLASGFYKLACGN